MACNVKGAPEYRPIVEAVSPCPLLFALCGAVRSRQGQAVGAQRQLQRCCQRQPARLGRGWYRCVCMWQACAPTFHDVVGCTAQRLFLPLYLFFPGNLCDNCPLRSNAAQGSSRREVLLECVAHSPQTDYGVFLKKKKNKQTPFRLLESDAHFACTPAVFPFRAHSG